MSEVRLIDGNALEQKMLKYAHCICHETTSTAESCAEMVRSAPTIDPESLRPASEKDNETTADASDALKAFVEQEVQFRLSGIFCIPDDKITSDVVDACVDDLCENSDAMFDYDSIDAHIHGTLTEYGISPDDC